MMYYLDLEVPSDDVSCGRKVCTVILLHSKQPEIERKEEDLPRACGADQDSHNWLGAKLFRMQRALRKTTVGACGSRSTKMGLHSSIFQLA